MKDSRGSEVAAVNCEPLVNRPSLGPLFAPALASWLAAVLAESASWCFLNGGVQLDAASIALTACAVTVLAYLVVKKRFRSILGSAVTVGTAFACAFACSMLFWSAWASDSEYISQALKGGEAFEAQLQSDPAERDYGKLSVARIAVAGRVACARVQWPDGTDVPFAGHKVVARGKLHISADDAARRYNHQQGYIGTIVLAGFDDAGAAEGLSGLMAPFRDASFARIENLGGEAAGLLAGVLLGNRTLYAGSELERDFKTTGLAHLMAVSGTHLAVVAALLGWAAGVVHARRKVRALLVGSCLILYTALTAFSPSAVRACIVCACGLGAGVGLRRASAVNALGGCTVCLLAFDPPIAYSVSFQLSVLAVFGVTVFSRLLSSLLGSILPGRLAPLADGCAAGYAAVVATLPVSVALFAQFPLLSPAATLLAAPLVTACVALGLVALCVSCMMPPLGQLLLGAVGVIASACCHLVHALAKLPFACLPLDTDAAVLGVSVAAALVLLWAVWPARSTPGITARILSVSGLFALPVLALLVYGLGGLQGAGYAFAPAAPSDAQVVMLNVGQGDAMLIRDAGSAVLVDTGEDAVVLKRALARHGVTRLDAVYVTHKDADHCGALPGLAGVVSVDHVFVHADLLSYDGERGVLEAARQVTGGKGAEGVRPGFTSVVGRFTLTLLSPAYGGESENNDSLVNLLAYDADSDGAPEARGLLTGDAEHEVLDEVCAACGSVDFVKVGHHGSVGAFSSEQLARLRPKLALIGVGKDNDYGHPTRETLDLLGSVGAKVFRTDVNGDIAVGFSDGHMNVSVQSTG